MKPSRHKVQKPPLISFNNSTIYEGDALTVLQRLPDESVQCIVTSPPYWGLRDYAYPDQIGLEQTLPQYINKLRAVFAEARRVLRRDGLFWLNIGDGYTSGSTRVYTVSVEPVSCSGSGSGSGCTGAVNWKRRTSSPRPVRAAPRSSLPLLKCPSGSIWAL